MNIFDKESISKLYLTRKARYFLMRAPYCHIASTKMIIGSSLQIYSQRQLYGRNHETVDTDITVEIMRRQTLIFFLTNTPLNFAYLKIKTNRLGIRENYRSSQFADNQPFSTSDPATTFCSLAITYQSALRLSPNHGVRKARSHHL